LGLRPESTPIGDALFRPAGIARLPRNVLLVFAGAAGIGGPVPFRLRRPVGLGRRSIVIWAVGDLIGSLIRGIGGLIKSLIRSIGVFGRQIRIGYRTGFRLGCGTGLRVPFGGFRRVGG